MVSRPRAHNIWRRPSENYVKLDSSFSLKHEILIFRLFNKIGITKIDRSFLSCLYYRPFSDANMHPPGNDDKHIRKATEQTLEPYRCTVNI